MDGRMDGRQGYEEIEECPKSRGKVSGECRGKAGDDNEHGERLAEMPGSEAPHRLSRSHFGTLNLAATGGVQKDSGGTHGLSQGM